MQWNVIDKLNELLERQKIEKDVVELDCEIASLGSWKEDMVCVETEEELILIFESYLRTLYMFLGQPTYNGLGPLRDADAACPKRYFENHDSALRCAWWMYKNTEVMLMLTGHDANTLQLIHISVSSFILPEDSKGVAR